MFAPLLDALYLIVALVTAPAWMKKARGGWGERFGNVEPLPDPTPGRPRLVLHAVSVGEINATRPLVEALGNDIDLMICATTDTGIARARELYADRFHVRRYPLDASWAVRRFMNRVQPQGVVLLELELWPNFLKACRRRDIPVCIVNGRLSARSFKGYRKIRFALKQCFASLAFAGVQDEAYRERFVAMGVPADHVRVVGNLKWDAPRVDLSGADALAASIGIDRSRPLVVAGSTAPGEDALLRRSLPEEAQLLCAPRRPEWREQAHEALAPCVRRSAPDLSLASHGRFLLDTMGELALAYALADIVVIGRSFADLHGSDPMEPASMGKPTLIGPAHSDFVAAVDTLKAGGGLIVTDQDQLAQDLGRILSDHALRERMGREAQATVAQHAGVGLEYARMVRTMLDTPTGDTGQTDG